MRLLILALAAALVGCAGLRQTENQVFKRNTGETLEYWLPVGEASAKHWAYAWASVAAYQDADDIEKRKPLVLTEKCPDPRKLLESQHWELWDKLPQLNPVMNGIHADKIYAVHLRPQVWSNDRLGIVIVAFGGTAFTSWEDWRSNLRWFIDPFTDPQDAYYVLSNNFIPLFVEEYQRRSGTTAGAWLKDAKVVATGHSLGGGLAQRFAYSLAAGQKVPVVKTVYAFNPSPVSGKRGVPSWEENAKGLKINRIYNRGEFLASVRSMLSWFTFDKGDGQIWTDYRYSDNWSWETSITGAIHAHQMFLLACFMKEKAKIPNPGTSEAKSPK